jgi:hypothetical protein
MEAGNFNIRNCEWPCISSGHEPDADFDPDVACRVHDGLDSKALDWQRSGQTGIADTRAGMTQAPISSEGEASIDGRLI